MPRIGTIKLKPRKPMVTQHSNFDAVPPPVEQYLSDARQALRDRRIDGVRFSPLITRMPLAALVERRKRLFDFLHPERKPYGLEVVFRRQLKRSKKNPEKRECQGQFDILAISEDLALVTSSLTGDENRNGPARFVDKAYPLARRPFFPSTILIRLIEHFAESRSCKATALDTWGFHRQSRSIRRDTEHQPPAAAAREMAEQQRFIHRMKVAFTGQGCERTRLSFDRNATVTLHRGNPTSVVTELIMPGVLEAINTEKTYAITRTPEPVKQEIVQLDFVDDPFDSFDAMHTLCDAVRQGEGLSVAVIHLNPYLQAQILDFFTGGAVELLVMDNRSVSILPRSGNCAPTVERVANTIFRHFGEGKSRRAFLT